MSSAVLPCAILAGGLATRLHPVTRSVPKALVPVAGEPFIRHQLRLLRRNGVSHVVVCVGYLGELIREALCAAPELGMNVHVRFDGPRLLGTAGALRAALPALGDAFFVLYGDSYLLCDFARVQFAFEQSGKSALMTVFANHGCWDKSNVEFVDGQIVAYDKRNRTPRMHHIDYGLGILSRGVLETLPANTPADLSTTYQTLLARRELAAYEVNERFYEIGSFEGLEQTRQYLAAHAADSWSTA